MTFHLLAVGTQQPNWIQTGFETYIKRLPKPWDIKLHEIPLTQKIDKMNAELLNRIPKEAFLVALDEHGKHFSTRLLAEQCQKWMERPPVYLLIGGPDGLSADCLARSDLTWSLSALTLPHGLVRVLVAEQIYRAYSLVQKHPYHRG